MILGLDIGGTKTAAVLGTRHGDIRWRKEILTKTDRGFKPVFSEITALAGEALVGSP